MLLFISNVVPYTLSYTMNRTVLYLTQLYGIRGKCPHLLLVPEITSVSDVCFKHTQTFKIRHVSVLMDLSYNNVV